MVNRITFALLTLFMTTGHQSPSGAILQINSVESLKKNTHAKTVQLLPNGCIGNCTIKFSDLMVHMNPIQRTAYWVDTKKVRSEIMNKINSEPNLVNEIRRLINVINDVQGEALELGTVKSDPNLVTEIRRLINLINDVQGDALELDTVKSDPNLVNEIRMKIDKIRFEEFSIASENANEKIVFSPTNKGMAVHLEDMNKYVFKFNVFNGKFVGLLEVFLDTDDDGMCIWRFTNYKCKENVHYIRESMNVMLPKKLDMSIAKYAGKLAAKHYAINSSKELTEWEKIDEPLKEAA